VQPVWDRETKAAQIKATIELGFRLSRDPSEERPAVNSPMDAVLVAFELSLLELEHLRVILLDSRNRVLDVVEVNNGSGNSS
jgi:DNA repair protein RadC